jgi:hypothetical protein
MQSARSACEEVFFDLKLRRDSGGEFCMQSVHIEHKECV